MRSWMLLVPLIAQVLTQAPPVYRGSWIGTAGPSQVYRGRWTGQVLPKNANAAQGSWSVLSDSKRTVIEGTWSAKKSVVRWQGTWAARAQNGRPFSGTWRADLVKSKSNTFQQLLEQTLKNQVAGRWASGRLHGNWWLQGGGP